MSTLADALAGIVDPRLEGAACAGLAPLFDPRETNESDAEWTTRRDGAIRVCQRCPIRAACATVAAEIPRTTHAGIWAGNVHPTQLTTSKEKNSVRK